MDFCHAKASLRKVVCDGQAEIGDPSEVIASVLLKSFQESILKERIWNHWISNSV